MSWLAKAGLNNQYEMKQNIYAKTNYFHSDSIHSLTFNHNKQTETLTEHSSSYA